MLTNRNSTLLIISGIVTVLSCATQLMGQEDVTIQALHGDQVIFGQVDDNNIRRPILIQSNSQLTKTISSLETNQLIHNICGCSNIIHSTYGKYQGIMYGQPSKDCFDTYYTLSIYEGTNVVSELEWEIFISEETEYSNFVPLYINEKENSIILFSDSKVISKYSFDGKKIFDYSFYRGSRDMLRSHFYADEDFLFLIFTDHIEVIDPSGNLRWTRDGDFVPTVKRASNGGASFIYDNTAHTGFNIGDNGMTNYTFSFLISDDVVILPNQQALKGFKLIDLRENRVISRLSRLIDSEYREVNSFTASKNGEYFGSFARRTLLSSTLDNFMIKIVSRDNDVLAEYIFDFPTPIEYTNFCEFQISNDGDTISLVYADLASNIYSIVIDRNN